MRKLYLLLLFLCSITFSSAEVVSSALSMEKKQSGDLYIIYPVSYSMIQVFATNHFIGASIGDSPQKIHSFKGALQDHTPHDYSTFLIDYQINVFEINRYIQPAKLNARLPDGSTLVQLLPVVVLKIERS